MSNMVSRSNGGKSSSSSCSFMLPEYEGLRDKAGDGEEEDEEEPLLAFRILSGDSEALWTGADSDFVSSLSMFAFACERRSRVMWEVGSNCSEGRFKA